MFKGVLNHFEQRFRLLFAVDNPIGIENFVAAMFGVSLRKHVQLDVCRVAAQVSEGVDQIVNFVFSQCQTQLDVGLFERNAACTEQINVLNRCRLVLGKQFFSIVKVSKYGFHHTVVQQRAE